MDGKRNANSKEFLVSEFLLIGFKGTIVGTLIAVIIVLIAFILKKKETEIVPIAIFNIIVWIILVAVCGGFCYSTGAYMKAVSDKIFSKNVAKGLMLGSAFGAVYLPLQLYIINPFLYTLLKLGEFNNEGTFREAVLAGAIFIPIFMLLGYWYTRDSDADKRYFGSE